jgi:hypothetical protein
VEILGSDQVHYGEESLAVMCMLEKVVFGHQSNRQITFSDGVRRVPKEVLLRIYRFPSRAIRKREQTAFRKKDFDALQSFTVGS